jgi:RNA polymerase sigma-70 factor (ECF subfamily)
LQHERATLLARAVAVLPDRQRAAITLTYDDDLPNAEAAAVLGTTVGAFELLLVRARRTLRQALQDA